MANLRLIYNNVADKATITASSTTSGLVAQNMQNTQKTSVHRSNSTSTVTYTLTWSTPQSINAVALPATNLQGSDKIDVLMYETSISDVAGPIAQLINKNACLGRSIILQGGATTSTYKDFGLGGATKTSLWFTKAYQVKAVEITLTRADIAQQIDCARIVCGQYWEPTRQISRGIDLGTQDQSEITTTRSGNTYVDRKTISDTLNFNIEYMSDADRKTLLQIMQTCGTNALIYYCLFPDNTNPEYTQAYSIYGRMQNTALQYQYLGFYSSNIQLNSW